MLLLIHLVVQGTCLLFWKHSYRNAILHNGEKLELQLKVYVNGNCWSYCKLLIICQIIFLMGCCLLWAACFGALYLILLEALVIIAIQIWQRCMAGSLYSDTDLGLNNAILAGLLELFKQGISCSLSSQLQYPSWRSRTPFGWPEDLRNRETN